VNTKKTAIQENNCNYFCRGSQRSFISKANTLKEGAHETALSVIMIDPLEPIFMTTHFVRIPLLSNSCPASIGFWMFVSDSACHNNKHEYVRNEATKYKYISLVSLSSKSG
jgi:hypothetical protein